MANVYTTPYLVNEQALKAPTGEVETTQQIYQANWELIKRYCYAYTRIIESQTQRVFVPVVATQNKYFSQEIRNKRFLGQRDTGQYVLDLDDDLLEATTITWYGTELTDDQYRLVGANSSADSYPYSRILFDGNSVPSFNRDFDSKIAIEGIWGVQDSSTYAYTDVGTLAAAIADTTTTSVSVADGNLYQVYQYIKIDDELMLITDIRTTGTPHILTVERGANGFTAATHLDAATVSRWNVVHDIQELGTRMCLYFYNKRNDVGEMIQVVDDQLMIAQFSKEIASIAHRRGRSLMGSA